LLFSINSKKLCFISGLDWVEYRFSLGYCLVNACRPLSLLQVFANLQSISYYLHGDYSSRFDS
jgi:hypothetical protein